MYKYITGLKESIFVLLGQQLAYKSKMTSNNKVSS